MSNLSTVPTQNREWLRQLRKLLGHTVTTMAVECEISYLTYMSVESGCKKSSRPASVRTVKAISSNIGIKTDLLYYPTDEQGRLTDKGCIVDILTLFTIKGYKYAVHTESLLRLIFAPELAEHILDSLTADMA